MSEQTVYGAADSTGGQERSDRGIDTGGQERSDRGIDTGGQERSDRGIDTGGQERSDRGINTGGQERSDRGINTGGTSMRSPKSAAGFEKDFAGASSRSRPCAPLTLWWRCAPLAIRRPPRILDRQRVCLARYFGPGHRLPRIYTGSRGIECARVAIMSAVAEVRGTSNGQRR